MAQSSVLLLLTMVAAVAVCCSALMLPQYARHTGGEYEYVDEDEPPRATPTPNHITRILHPSEIRSRQTLEEFTNVVDAAVAATLTSQAATPKANDAQRQEKTLTYTELSQLLAMWQLEKERNAYEMQTERHRHSAYSGNAY